MVQFINARVKVTTPLYKSLTYLKTESCYMSPWWHVAYKCPEQSYKCSLVVQLLVLLNRTDEHRVCYNCDTHVRTSTHHIYLVAYT